MALDVVVIEVDLILVGDSFDDLDFFLTRESFKGDSVTGHELSEEVGELFFPDGEVASDGDDGRGENEGVAAVSRVFSGSVGVEGDEGAHALATPDDFGLGVLLLNEAGEAVEVAEPLAAMADIALAGGDGIISLTAGFGGVDGGAGEVRKKVLGERAVIRGRSGDAMDGDEDELRFAFWQPFGEGQDVAIKAMK